MPDERSTSRGAIRQLTARQVNLLLAIATFGALVTGFVSWGVGTGWARWWTATHAVFGLLVMVLAPAKVRGSVRTGLRRSRPSRWISVLFGVVVVACVVFGLLHSTGVWTGVGYWSPLWTHVLLGAVAIPLLGWHLWARTSRPQAVDVDRRLAIGGGVATLTAAAVVATVEGVASVAELRGSHRVATGSFEVASFDPAAMPVVSWIDDRTPELPPDDWPLRVDGRVVRVAELHAEARPLVARLDCTGGWWSAQRWHVVPVASVLGSDARRSFEVVSATGYRRTFPMRDAADVHLAVGYGDRPLRSGHGAPVRIVAPGRRGLWWVKWVVAIEPTDRPWWLQLPFPAT